LSYSVAFQDTAFTEFNTNVYLPWHPAKWHVFWCSHEQHN